jgi:flagellar protein FlbD
MPPSAFFFSFFSTTTHQRTDTMITLHRLGHQVERFQLNPDLIVTVEANPDTTITLTTGAKIVVAEPPEKVAGDMRHHRVEVLAAAMERRHELHLEQNQQAPRRSAGQGNASSAALVHLAPVEADGA